VFAHTVKQYPVAISPNLAKLPGAGKYYLDLRKAHNTLDKAVEQAYRKEKFADDMERLGFLFGRYRALA
jgi:hypothetical protein